MREKYVRMYEKFISQLKMYGNVIENSFKGLFANFSFASNEITENFK